MLRKLTNFSMKSHACCPCDAWVCTHLLRWES